MDWKHWNKWILVELPQLNRAVLSGAGSPEASIAQLRFEFLDTLPPAEVLPAADARRMLVLLDLVGASVARHRQEADLSLKQRPSDSFDRLPVGATGTPFLGYFAELAAATGTGHADRDCYASLVRWNAPTTRVELDGQTLAVLPGSFPDLNIRTYTGNPGEYAFFELLKKSEALELAVNDTLEPVALGTTDIRSPEAAGRALAAARLMSSLIRLSEDFLSTPPGNGGLDTGHFLDVFRQFLAHWRPGDIPPSGAQDSEFLRRDLLLGIDFPEYDRHVRRMYPALLDSERTELDRCVTRPPLPVSLLGSLGISAPALTAASPADLARTADEHPQLAAWYFLLAANAKYSAVHLRLTEKYMFKPQRMRDRSGVGDRPLVSNRIGSTGMGESLLVQLTRARRNHVLRPFARVPRQKLAALCGMDRAQFEREDLPKAHFVASAR